MKLDFPNIVFYAVENGMNVEKDKLIECITTCGNILDDIDAKFSHDPEDPDVVKDLHEQRAVILNCWYNAISVLRKKAIAKASNIEEMISIAHMDSVKADPKAVDTLARFIVLNGEYANYDKDEDIKEALKNEIIKWEFYEDIMQKLKTLPNGTFTMVKIPDSSNGWIRLS